MKDPRVLLILKIMQCLSSEELDLTFAWEWSGPDSLIFPVPSIKLKAVKKRKQSSFMWMEMMVESEQIK